VSSLSFISFSHIIPSKENNSQWWDSVKYKYGIAGVTLAEFLVNYTTNPQFPRSQGELRKIFISFTRYLHPNKGGNAEKFKEFMDVYEKLNDKLEDIHLNNIYQPKMKDKQPGVAGGKRYTHRNTHRNTHHGKKVSQRMHRKKHTLRKQRKQRK